MKLMKVFIGYLRSLKIGLKFNRRFPALKEGWLDIIIRDSKSL